MSSILIVHIAMLFVCISFSLLALGVIDKNVSMYWNRVISIIVMSCIPLLVSLPSGTVSIFNGLLSYGGVSNFTCLVLCVLGVSLLLYGGNDFCEDSYGMFGMCSILGGMVLISSNDLITLFLGIELQSFSVYLIAGTNRSSLSSTGAALKYFLLGSLSTGLILLGTTVQYNYAGTSSLDVSFCVPGLVFVVCGLYFKVAASPFHAWAPDVYDGVRSSVSAWLQVMPKRALVLFVVHLNSPFSYYIGILSIVRGSIYGVSQSRVRRLLAYSTISHVGFLLLSHDSSTVVYLLSYSMTTMCALFTLHVLNDGGNLKDLAGIGKRRPVLATSFGILLFSLAGIPPLFGFFAKAMVLQEVVGNQMYTAATIAVLCSVISAYYYLSVVSLMFFSPLNGPSSVSLAQQDIGSTQSYLVSVFTGFVIFYILVHPITINFCNVVVSLNTIYALTIFVPVVVLVLFLANWVLAKEEGNAEKASAYECGFEAMQQTRQPFNIRYYLVAVMFLLLDLEVALLFPVVVSLFQEGSFLYGFSIVRIFLGMLTIGFAYEFGKGALHIASQRASVNRVKI